ncbi:MAG TPA: 50S ribosomal protein L11 methyltransferase, partial [Blastocatellia bacterium]|nr:50S ribosomal protein L11 methyltransferase [Blastocatellia bacterium]
MVFKHSDRISTWRLIELEVGRDAEALVSMLAFELGSTGIVTLEERDDAVKLGAYFGAQADAEEIADTIRVEVEKLGRSGELRSISFSVVPDQDWMQKWKEGFEPTEIGSRLVIAPSWKLPNANGARIVVQIDPGMAFGTGTHETTRMCLEAVEKYWRGGNLLDVGTGTGIIAIAAALLEPGSRITAIDIDPQAVVIARENASINNASNSVEIVEGGPRGFVGGAFDVVEANLTAEVIISLIDDLA